MLVDRFDYLQLHIYYSGDTMSTISIEINRTELITPRRKTKITPGRRKSSNVAIYYKIASQFFKNKKKKIVSIFTCLKDPFFDNSSFADQNLKTVWLRKNN